MAEHGLYVDSLIYEIEYQDIKFDENYRKQLEEKADKEGLENLYNMAKKIDEEAVKNKQIERRIWSKQKNCPIPFHKRNFTIKYHLP